MRLEPDSARAHYNLGLACNGLHRFEEAVDYFTRLISLDGQNPAAHFELGKAYRGLKRTDEEMQSYKDALNIKPDYFDAVFHLGAAFLKTKRGSEDGVKYIESGGQLLFDDPEHIFYLSLCSLAYGRKDDAIATASQLKESSPELFRELLECANAAS